MQKLDLILKNAFSLIYENNMYLKEKVDIGINDGKIVIIKDLIQDPASEVIDCRGLTVLPGIIDSQVHFREPGLTHKEDIESGTRSAVLGGITSVFEMPNTTPATIDEHSFNEKIRLSQNRAWSNIAFYLGAANTNSSDLKNLENLRGCCGVKIFMGSSTGSLLVEDDEHLLSVLKSGKRRVAIHAEDEARMKDRKQIAIDGKHARFHPEWRDVQSALLASQRIVRLAKMAQRNIHILHLSTAEEVEFLAAHKNVTSLEVLPQHLTFAGPEIYERLGNYAQQNPPIRDARHRETLWQGVQKGIIDVIGSDHAPHTRDEKNKEYPSSPSGVPGVQTLVPIMLNHVAHGRFSLEHFVRMTTENVCRLFNLPNKGRIAVGYDADFTIVDLKRTDRIENRWIASKCGWTPYDGMEVTGWPTHTIINGKISVRDGSIQGEPKGAILTFNP